MHLHLCFKASLDNCFRQLLQQTLRAPVSLLADIRALFNSPIVSSPLLTGSDLIDNIGIAPITPDGTIGHSGSTENVGLKGSEVNGSLQVGISEVSTTSVRFHIAIPQISHSEVSSITTSSSHFAPEKISSIERSPIQTSFPQPSILQISLTEIGVYQLTSAEVSTLQISPQQNSASQISSLQPGVGEISFSQIACNHLSTSQLSTRKVNVSQVGSYQVGSVYDNVPEIPFPASISLQQFFGSHNFALQNTTVPTWLSYLGGTTPFNSTSQLPTSPPGSSPWLASDNHSHSPGHRLGRRWHRLPLPV